MWVFFIFCTFRDSMFTLKSSVIAKKESCFQFKTKFSLWITIMSMLWIVSFVKNFTPVIYENRVLIFLSKMRFPHFSFSFQIFLQKSIKLLHCPLLSSDYEVYWDNYIFNDCFQHAKQAENYVRKIIES